MTIIAIRPWLAAAPSDADDSEAVAVSLVEFLLAETNAYYQQHVMVCKAIRSAAAHIRDSALDAVFAAVLAPDQLLPHKQFTAECTPIAEARDRHVARSLPFKSPEKHHYPIAEKLASPSRAVRSENSPDRAVGGSWRRRNMDCLPGERPTEAIAQVLTLPEEPEERSDIKIWRLKCLKEMTTASRRSTIVKWGNVARAFKISDHKSDGSEDVDVIDSQPSLLRQELLVTSSSTKTLKLKSSVDCFLNVLDLEPRDESEERTSVITTSRSNIMRDVSIQVTRKATSAAKSSRMKPVKQLNDKLSRRRTGASACGSSSPWRFESSAFQDVFRPERSDFNAYALPSTIALASGVTLSQGESKIEGPEPVKHTSTMSKKRFDLHQRLATDCRTHAAELELFAGRSPRGSSPGSPPFHMHSELYKQVEEVPAEPIPMPTLSCVSASALVIPHNHLSASLSTPSLRVRSSKASQLPSPNGRLVALQDLDPVHKPRPSTSFKSASATSIGFERTAATALHQQHNRRHGARSAEASKYMREFPKPKPGVIKVTAASSRDDDRQRLAWGP